MAISDYVNKHKQAGTLGQKTTPVNLTVALPSTPTPIKDRNEVISAGKPEQITPLRKLARKLPFNFERNVYDKFAEVGKFLAPSPVDLQKQIIDENPTISDVALQKELKRRITSSGDIPLTGKSGEITADTKILALPDIGGMVKRVGSKVAGKGEQAVLRKVAASTPVSPAKTAEATVAKKVRNPSEFVSSVTPPKKVAPVQKERGFITSVKEQIPIATKAEGMYTARPTTPLGIKAANLVKDDINEARRVIRDEKGENMVAVASEMIKHLARQADAAPDQAVKDTIHEEISRVAHQTAEKLTQAGRDVQAASLLAMNTPEGNLRFFAREINKYNEKNPTRKIPNITKEESAWIVEESKRIQSMPEGEEKAMAFDAFQKQMRERIPSPMLDKLQSFWRAGLLTGIKTSGLNLASNIVHSTAEAAKDIPASMADIAMSWVTGQRTKGATLGGTGTGIKEGLEKGWRFWKTGYDPRDIGRAYEHTQVRFKNKLIQKYVDTVFRTIAAPDQPMYYGALRRSLREQAVVNARKEGLRGDALRARVKQLEENPTEDMALYSAMDAEQAVFLNQTELGKVAKGLQDLPGGRFVVPFARTPSAVAMQVLNYSPAGIPLEVARQIRKGKFDQRLMAQAIGRSATGSPVAAWLGTELYNNDMISLDYPKTEREREQWKNEGRIPNSVKIGGQWRTVQVLGPLGPILLLGAHFEKAMEDTGSPTSAMIEALGGTLKSFTESTFLRGVNDLLESLFGTSGSLTNYAASFISSWIPVIINDIARSTDPKERVTSAAQFKDAVMKRVMARIPSLRQELEPQVDTLGREIPRATDSVSAMIDPTRPSQERETAVTKELRRLGEAGFPASPTRPGDKFGFSILSEEQNTRLWKNAGTLTNKKLEALIKNEEYQSLSDEEKAKYVTQFVTKSQQRARAQMVLELTKGMSGQQLRAELKRLKESGLLTEPVLNDYLALRGEE